jgi:hypothetical protein
MTTTVEKPPLGNALVLSDLGNFRFVGNSKNWTQLEVGEKSP